MISHNVKHVSVLVMARLAQVAILEVNVLAKNTLLASNATVVLLVVTITPDVLLVNATNKDPIAITVTQATANVVVERTSQEHSVTVANQDFMVSQTVKSVAATLLV